MTSESDSLGTVLRKSHNSISRPHAEDRDRFLFVNRMEATIAPAVERGVEAWS